MELVDGSGFYLGAFSVIFVMLDSGKSTQEIAAVHKDAYKSINADDDFAAQAAKLSKD